jgi:transcription antitermination protein NusB
VPERRREDTDDPRRSRARALKLLFQADIRGVAPDTLLDALTEGDRDLLDGEDAAGTPPIDDFTRSLVRGVSAHRDEIDALIQQFARRWAIHRMPVVDRTVLRLATYELVHEDTSPAVVINEAVELAKELSTQDSGRYVNGVLESIRRSLADAPDDAPPDAGEPQAAPDEEPPDA